MYVKRSYVNNEDDCRFPIATADFKIYGIDEAIGNWQSEIGNISGRIAEMD